MTLQDVKLIGKRISTIRKSKGITQIDMAFELGYSERQYRRIETEGTADLMKLAYIAEALKVSLFSLLPTECRNMDTVCPSSYMSVESQYTM